jgi:hypothetical protein
VFNAIIENLYLREPALSGRQFTWPNRRPISTYEKLDRVRPRAAMHNASKLNHRKGPRESYVTLSSPVLVSALGFPRGSTCTDQTRRRGAEPLGWSAVELMLVSGNIGSGQSSRVASRSDVYECFYSCR